MVVDFSPRLTLLPWPGLILKHNIVRLRKDASSKEPQGMPKHKPVNRLLALGLGRSLVGHFAVVILRGSVGLRHLGSPQLIRSLAFGSKGSDSWKSHEHKKHHQGPPATNLTITITFQYPFLLSLNKIVWLASPTYHISSWPRNNGLPDILHANICVPSRCQGLSIESLLGA